MRCCIALLLLSYFALSLATQFSGSLNAGGTDAGHPLSLNQASYDALLQQQQVTSDQAACGISCMLLILEVIASGSGLTPTIKVMGANATTVHF